MQLFLAARGHRNTDLFPALGPVGQHRSGKGFLCCLLAFFSSGLVIFGSVPHKNGWVFLFAVGGFVLIVDICVLFCCIWTLYSCFDSIFMMISLQIKPGLIVALCLSPCCLKCCMNFSLCVVMVQTEQLIQHCITINSAGPGVVCSVDFWFLLNLIIKSELLIKWLLLKMGQWAASSELL